MLYCRTKGKQEPGKLQESLRILRRRGIDCQSKTIGSQVRQLVVQRVSASLSTTESLSAMISSSRVFESCYLS